MVVAAMLLAVGPFSFWRLGSLRRQLVALGEQANAEYSVALSWRSSASRSPRWDGFVFDAWGFFDASFAIRDIPTWVFLTAGLVPGVAALVVDTAFVIGRGTDRSPS